MGKINASDKIMFKNQKKRENIEIKEFFYIRLSKTLFGMKFTACDEVGHA